MPPMSINKEETRTNQAVARVIDAIPRVRLQVDMLSHKVVALERSVHGGTKAEDKEFMMLIELLMKQLLKLDQIEADGEAKLLRKKEVYRVQRFIEMLDDLRERNHEMLHNAKPEQTKQELPLPGFGSLCLSVSPKPSTVITQHWEMFD